MFDWLLHELLIAKLHACGLELTSLKILQPYLVKRKQNENKRYRPWSEILIGVCYGSIFRPLLFHILCDSFLFVTNLHIVNSADGNTLHCSGKHFKEVNSDFGNDSEIFLKWFYDKSKFWLKLSFNKKNSCIT